MCKVLRHALRTKGKKSHGVYSSEGGADTVVFRAIFSLYPSSSCNRTQIVGMRFQTQEQKVAVMSGIS